MEQKTKIFRPAVFCQKGREGPYQRFGRIADEITVLNKFKDMASAKIQKELRESNTIIVPHRSLTVYLGYKTIENSFQGANFWKQKIIPSRRENCKKRAILSFRESQNKIS